MYPIFYDSLTFYFFESCKQLWTFRNLELSIKWYTTLIVLDANFKKQPNPQGPSFWVHGLGRMYYVCLFYLNFKSNFFFWFPFSCLHFFLYLLREGDFNEIKGLFLFKFMHFDPTKQESISNSKSWKDFFFFLNKIYMDLHKFAHIYTPSKCESFALKQFYI